MTSRRSSGSSRAASSVEPTKSQNITVSCRRSASPFGARVVVVSPGGPEASAAGVGAAKAAMADGGDPQIAQILGGQPPQDRIVDVIVAESRRVLCEPQSAQPLGNIERHGRSLPRGVARLATSGVHRENPAVVDHGFEASSWTQITRPQHSRGRLRYGSDLTDAEVSYAGPDRTISGGWLRLPDPYHVRAGGRGAPGAPRGVRAADGRAAQGRYAP